MINSHSIESRTQISYKINSNKHEFSIPHFIVPNRNVQTQNNRIRGEVSHNNENVLIVRNIALNIENNNNRKCGQH